MPIYRLEYRAEGAEDKLVMEFDAPSTAFALCVVESEPIGLEAALFQDGKLLCRRGDGSDPNTRCWVLA
jgi:hypothetical protein